MTYSYYIAAGSNIHPRREYINRAVSALTRHGRIAGESPLYRSEAYGVREQAEFLNAVLEWHSDLPPLEALALLKRIEKETGRRESFRWGPREIDLDIIDYNGREWHDEQLTIPHADFENRLFVLYPLRDVAPDYRNRRGQTLTRLIENCSDRGEISLYTPEAYVP